MASIALHGGLVALVDDSDLERVLAAGAWYKLDAPDSRTYYVWRSVKRADGYRTTQLLHRFLLEPPKGVQVDHINLDGLDNRRCNLRLCSSSENCYNTALRADNTSGVKGVSWDTRRGQWETYIWVDKRRVHLGRFDKLEDAAAAVAEARARLHGEYARHG